MIQMTGCVTEWTTLANKVLTGKNFSAGRINAFTPEFRPCGRKAEFFDRIGLFNSGHDADQVTISTSKQLKFRRIVGYH